MKPQYTPLFSLLIDWIWRLWVDYPPPPCSALHPPIWVFLSSAAQVREAISSLTGSFLPMQPPSGPTAFAHRLFFGGLLSCFNFCRKGNFPPPPKYHSFFLEARGLPGSGRLIWRSKNTFFETVWKIWWYERLVRRVEFIPSFPIDSWQGSNRLSMETPACRFYTKSVASFTDGFGESSTF